MYIEKLKIEGKKKLICFDLMDTVIICPPYELIRKWMDNQPIKFGELTNELFSCGYPYAAFVEDSEFTFEDQKSILLTNEVNEFEDLYRNLNIKDKDEVKEKVTLDYAEFFINNCMINEDIKNIINTLKKDSVIGIVSNLYTIYKEIIEKFQLNSMFDFFVLSCSSGCRKPENEIFEIIENIKKDMDLEAAFFVGDNWKSDIEASKKKGFTPILINSKNEFLKYLIKKGCSFLLEENEGKVKVKEKYASNLRKYVSSEMDFNNVQLKRDIEIINSKIIIKGFEDIYCADAYKELEKIFDSVRLL